MYMTNTYLKKEAARLVANRLIHDIAEKLTDEDVASIIEARDAVQEAQVRLRANLALAANKVLH